MRTKIIVINLIVFIGFLCLFEIGLRAYWTVRSCVQTDCDFSRIQNLEVIKREPFSPVWKRVLRFDKTLGYVPSEGFTAQIDLKGWNGAILSIDQASLRSHGSGLDPYDVLTVGDSFTFGDQVSDHETWPYCLEHQSGMIVANAGVPGYGAAQAVLRAQTFVKKHEVDLVIWSVLLNDDFRRDRLIYRDGLPRPAVKKQDDMIQWAPLPIQNATGTRFGRYGLTVWARLLKPVYQYSLLGHALIKRLPVIGIRVPDFSGRNMYKTHPQAASELEIIAFAMREFQKINVKKKLMLLQYAAYDFTNEIDWQRIDVLRRVVHQHADELNLQLVDSFSFFEQKLTEFTPGEIWNGHHTALGNELVCSFLLPWLR